MSSVDQKIVPLVSPDGRLKVEFLWSDDRFTHRILLDEVEVARSIEGDCNDLWPASPPMQQLSLEPIGGSDAVLGVGLAGRTHWSLSVEQEKGEGSAAGFRFEWAARCREAPSQIGSAYLVDNSVHISACDDPPSRERRGDAQDSVNQSPHGPAAPDSEDQDGWCELVIEPHAVPAAGIEGSDARTFRWCYRITSRN